MEDQTPQPSEHTFDISSAVADIGEGLGFDTKDTAEAEPAAESAETEETPTDSGATSSDAPEPAPASASPAPANPPPKTWRPDALAEWEKLSPTVQAEVLKREEDMFKGIEGYKEHATVGKEVQSMIAPYEQMFREAGVNPIQTVGNLMRAHVILATGTPEQKAQMFQQIVTGYGLQDHNNAPYVDPTISALQNEIAVLKSQLNGIHNQTRESQVAQTKAVVDAFAADPANVYFEEVANDIAAMLKSGTAKDLKEAYEKAIWANPVTRAKEVARLQTEKEAAARAEMERKAQEAKEASAANLKASPKPASVTAPAGSMEETMQLTLAKINARK